MSCPFTLTRWPYCKASRRVGRVSAEEKRKHSQYSTDELSSSATHDM